MMKSRRRRRLSRCDAWRRRSRVCGRSTRRWRRVCGRMNASLAHRSCAGVTAKRLPPRRLANKCRSSTRNRRDTRTRLPWPRFRTVRSRRNHRGCTFFEIVNLTCICLRLADSQNPNEPTTKTTNHPHQSSTRRRASRLCASTECTRFTRCAHFTRRRLARRPPARVVAQSRTLARISDTSPRVPPAMTTTTPRRRTLSRDDPTARRCRRALAWTAASTVWVSASTARWTRRPIS